MIMGAILPIFIVGLVLLLVYQIISRRNKQQPEQEEHPSPPQNKEPKAKAPKKRVLAPKKRNGVAQPLETAERVIDVGNTQPICISFDPKGQYFLIPCRNRTQLLYNFSAINTCKGPIQRYNLIQDSVVDSQLINDEEDGLVAVLALDMSNSVQSFKLNPSSKSATEGPIQIRTTNHNSLEKIGVTQDKKFVATLGDQTYVRVFRPNGQVLIGFDTGQLRNVDLAVNGDLVTASSYTNDVVFYGATRDNNGNITRFQKAFVASDHKDRMQTVNFHRDGEIFVSGGKDGKFNIFQVPQLWREGGDKPRLLKSGTTENLQPIRIIRICPVDEVLAILTDDGQLHFWKDSFIKTIPVPHQQVITHMEWTPDGAWLFVLSTGSNYVYGYRNPLL